jgi:hypothetical protein
VISTSTPRARADAMARDAASAADSGSPFFFFFVCADKDTSEESGSVQRTRSPARASAGIAPSSPRVEKCLGPMLSGIRERAGRSVTAASPPKSAPTTPSSRVVRSAPSAKSFVVVSSKKRSSHPSQPFSASSTTSALVWPASARLTWYGEPT